MEVDRLIKQLICVCGRYSTPVFMKHTAQKTCTLYHVTG